MEHMVSEGVPLTAVEVPGRKDAWLYPPIGRFPFKRIIAMSEPQIDEAVRLRHQLDSVFEGTPYEGEEGSPAAARRLIVKRAAFMLLEGYSTNGKEFERWYLALHAELKADDPLQSIRSTLEQKLSKPCHDRIEKVRSRVAREAVILAPNPEIMRLERRIQHMLSRRGKEVLSLSDIVNLEHIPPHARTNRRIIIDIKTILQIFLLQIGMPPLSNEETARRFGLSTNALEVHRTKYLRKRARALIAEIRKE